MKFPKLFSTGKKAEELESSVETGEHEETEEVSKGTKVKVIAALFVVAFATYVAYWVQEPSDNLKADVLSTTQETTATAEPVMTTEAASTEAMTTSTQQVSIIDFSFDPANLQVEKGTTVVWTNKDSVPHTVTGENFTSGTLNSGDTFEHTFTNDGTYNYSCSFHPQMKGSVQVGVPAEATQMTESSEMLMTPTEELHPAMVTPTEQVFPAAVEPAVVEPPVVTPAPELVSATTSNVDQMVNAASDTSVTQETMAAHSAADEKGRQLVKSGPEQIVYLGIFVAILYFNRRKLTGLAR